MAAFLHSGGPTHVYAAFRTAGAGPGPFPAQTPQYLGTAESSPIVEAQQFVLDVKNDLAGRQATFASVDDGEEHVVTMAINRFDYTVWKAVRDRVNHQASVAGHGWDTRLKRGTVITGSYDIALVLAFEFAAFQPSHPQIAADYPLGRYYYSAHPASYREDKTGTRIDTVAVAFRCVPVYDTADKIFKLYTEDPAKLGTIPPPS